jgi:hypothetical protein
MSDFLPKPGIKIGGLSRKAQKLQALREKAAANTSTAAKPLATASTGSFKAKGSFVKKTSFQRKAV